MVLPELVDYPGRWPDNGEEVDDIKSLISIIIEKSTMGEELVFNLTSFAYAYHTKGKRGAYDWFDAFRWKNRGGLVRIQIACTDHSCECDYDSCDVCPRAITVSVPRDEVPS